MCMFVFVASHRCIAELWGLMVTNSFRFISFSDSFEHRFLIATAAFYQQGIVFLVSTCCRSMLIPVRVAHATEGTRLLSELSVPEYLLHVSRRLLQEVCSSIVCANAI